MSSLPPPAKSDLLIPLGLQPAVHECVLRFVERQAPEELPYLSVIWEHYLSPGQDPLKRMRRRSAWRRSALKLGFDREEAVRLISPCVILVVAGVLTELGDSKWEPSLEQVRSAVRAAAVQLDASELLSSSLAERLGPEILSIWRGARRSSSAQAKLHDQSSVPAVPEDHCWLDIFKDGVLHQTHDTLAGLWERRNELSFDIVINEPADILMTPGLRTGLVGRVSGKPPKLLGMLWLVLRRAPEGVLSHIEIVSRLMPGDKSLSEIRANRIYQYRARLNKLLTPEPCRRVFVDGAIALYSFQKTGWSYFWLRRERDPAKSLLLQPLLFQDAHPVEPAG